ncbi:SpoIIE family protein phosphatase [Streptomyces sp. NPDC015346]|uniref:SpoIIE family protein phosphatase n=1 Tax=Streptomyces sp. NPDC015346 TaxID=3364954 RepID=UPI0036F64291
MRGLTAPEDRPDDPLDAVHPATATVDEGGVVTGWSEGATRLLGYSREDVVGRAAARLLAEDVTEAAKRSLSGHESWNGRVMLRHRSGHCVQADLLAHHRVAANGVDWLVVWTTARRSAPRVSDALVRSGFDQSPSILAIYDTDLRSVLANAEMQNAVALTDEQMRGMRLPEIVPDNPEAENTERAMRRALETGERQHLEHVLRVPGESRQHAWSVSLAPLKGSSGQLYGVGLAARDLTEQFEARQRLLLLNEASSRIGTTLDMARSAQELADVAVPRLADFVTVDLLVSLEDGGEPPSGPLSGPVTMRRVARQSVIPGAPESVVELGGMATYPALSPPAECLASGRPARYEMTDSAVAGWTAHDPARGARIRDVGIHSVMVVPLQARHIILGVVLFLRHRRPEPFEEDDLLLAEEITVRAAVCVDNARRYTRERTTAVTLQRSLLPQTTPGQAAVETASRYRPAGSRAGVGGDWFDVIPLSGARTALVIGDVVGHGIQASVTMGRLRTAVRTLADIDLPPDELLTHLDDVVIRMSTETAASAGTPSAEATVATCLYAVYDPVSRRCTLARAGHPLPAAVGPDGAAYILDLPAGPPLGLGGLPFEAVEVELPEGSLLALYTDGLVKGRDRDIDEGLEVLRQALADPAPSLDAVCDAALDALLPAGTDDDAALLLARSRALGASQVATWDVPSDPSVVARTRADVAHQLAVWGLEEALFTTELVVSELVTNAIRYGRPPIQLRLIHDRTLICEVSDNSNTAPHLRRARAFDEGGRGLLLVAQLTQRWGTRHAREGKTIWAEQDLPVG